MIAISFICSTNSKQEQPIAKDEGRERRQGGITPFHDSEKRNKGERRRGI